MPSCTSEGVFGIARTTRAPAGRCDSIHDVVTPAATESSVCSGETDGRDLLEHGVDVLRLDGDDREARAADCLGVRLAGRDAVALAELGSPLGPARGDDEVVGRPPARAQEPTEKRLAQPACADDRDPPLHQRLDYLRAAVARRRFVGSGIIHACPKRRISRMIGRSARPFSVSSYSTRGGDSG